MKRIKRNILLSLLLGVSLNLSAAGNKNPDCSKDDDGRIFRGLWFSLIQNKDKNAKYINDIASKKSILKVTGLSSEKISKNEAKKLMMRRAKQDGLKEPEIKESGITLQYLSGDIYRQYYLIESSSGLKAIAEYYTAVFSDGNGPDLINCAADMKDIYIISDHIEGYTADFAWR